MKQIAITILLVVLALPIAAANANIERANQAYNQELYNEALKLYQTIKDKYFNSMAYQTIDAYIERASAK